MVEVPIDHVLRGVHDQIDLVGRQLAELDIRQRGALLEDAERADHGPAPPVALQADREVAVRALGLGAPQVIGGDLDLTERVLLDADLIVVAIAGWHVAPHALEAPQSPSVTEVPRRQQGT